MRLNELLEEIDSLGGARLPDFEVSGISADSRQVKPGFILTSMVKRVDVAVYNTVKELVEGRFNGGIHLFGLDNDGVGYALDEYNEKAIPPAVLEAVERARQDIIAGRIKVTDAMAK